ncbi:hypothetical protein SAMN05421780_104222 [Flexibacter flexilis DSM 6793]|uniref:Uncharacterized protein n=1 Tax=Flexibacter flexilis DSM 6793 TaxID=927664 RepID=A0A1I1IE85_9BACT|nr:hypothetical protein [Flexibacter flexilis]SFC31530.1 hypothetical protein SAMN05421780_104222 [Flexibacter flexilis DSM 6793]
MRIFIAVFLLVIFLTESIGQTLKINDSIKCENIKIDIKVENKDSQKQIQINMSNSNSTKDIWTILTGLLTPIIALGGLGIAYRQWVVQRYRAKFDLFERRMKVYENIREVLISILRNNTLEGINMEDFYMNVRHSKFLFNKEISAYIEQIDKNVSDFQTDCMKLGENEKAPFMTEEQRNKVLDNKYNTLDWLSKQVKILDNNFSSFMEISKI